MNTGYEEKVSFQPFLDSRMPRPELEGYAIPLRAPKEKEENEVYRGAPKEKEENP